MTRPPEPREGETGRWAAPLRDKRGPAIHPGEGLGDLALWWFPAVCFTVGFVMVLLHELRFGILVLAAGTSSRGPGPLVSAIIKQGAQIGGRKLPVTIVPGELTEDEIEDLA